MCLCYLSRQANVSSVLLPRPQSKADETKDEPKKIKKDEILSAGNILNSLRTDDRQKQAAEEEENIGAQPTEDNGVVLGHARDPIVEMDVDNVPDTVPTADTGVDLDEEGGNIQIVGHLTMLQIQQK